MSKYYCPQCKARFDEPETYEDRSPFADPWAPYISCCPGCGNEYYEKEEESDDE